MKWKMIAITALVVLGGCVPTLHPLYTDADLVFEPALLGCWDADKGETWTFAKETDNSYTMTLVSNNKTGKFTAHLLKLDNTLYLDLIPQKMDIDAADFYQLYLYPVHVFMKVYQISPTLEMAVMDIDWLKKYLKENPDAIEYTFAGKDNKQPIITASTSELQAFVKAHANDKDAWEQRAVMSRCKPAIPKKSDSDEPKKTKSQK